MRKKNAKKTVLSVQFLTSDFAKQTHIFDGYRLFPKKKGRGCLCKTNVDGTFSELRPAFLLRAASLKKSFRLLLFLVFIDDILLAVTIEQITHNY